MSALAAVLLVLSQDSLDALKERFEAERERAPAERAAVLELIAALRSDEAADFLGKAFEAEKDEDLRRLILRSLADCGSEEAVRRLVSIAKDPKVSLALREAAVEALYRTPTRAAYDLFVELARSGGALRARAFQGLLSYPLAGTETLWRGALEDADPEIRRLAFRMLAPLKDRKVLDLAMKAIQDRDESAALRIGAVAAWKAQGGVEAVKLLLAAAVDAEPEVREAISEALGAVEGDKAAEALYEGLRDQSKFVRLAAVGALARLNHARALDRLVGVMRGDKELEVRLAAVEALAVRGDRKSEEVLRREAQKSEGETVFAAIRALAGYPSEESIKLLGRLSEQGSVEVRVTALEALGLICRQDLLPFFEKALRSREWPIRVVAVRQLSRLRTREVVDLLVERMGKEDGRLVGDIAEALRLLTGKGLGYSPAHWRDWWAVNRETFAFGSGAEEGPGVGVTTYHGLPVVSRRIIFCLDISGSMDSPIGDRETRLGMAKKELVRTLSNLDRAAQVNIVFFDDRIEPWMRQLVPARANLQRALQLIDSVKPRGGTNIFDALELCFTDSRVDTIYLLSDGEPNSGKFTDAEDILREIRRMNRARQIAIHTVSLGPSEFMRRLAEENWGRCVEKK